MTTYGGMRTTAALRAILAVGALAWVVVHGVMNNPGAIALFAQSDSLLPANWVHDLAYFPQDWRWFKLPQVPSFVPDFVLYPLDQALTGSWRVAMIVYAAQMAATLAVLGGLVAARISGRSRTTAITAMAGVLAVVFAGTTLTGRSAILNYSPSALEFPESIWLFVLLPVTHGGPFLLSILAALLGSEWILEQGSARRWSMTWLIALGVASDGVFIVECAIPLLATALIHAALYRQEIEARKLTAHVVFGCVIGLLFPLAFYHGSLPKIAFAKFGRYIAHLLHDFASLPPAWLALAFWLVSMVAAIRRFRSAPGGREYPTRTETGPFLELFGMVAAVVALAGCAAMYIDAGIYRYALAWVWWPFILLVGMSLRPHGPDRLVTAQSGGLGILALLPAICALSIVFIAPPQRTGMLTGWHSRAERCLAGIRTLRHLHAGLANYSLARSVAGSTDFAWQIDQIDDVGAVRPWGNDTRAYYRDFDAPVQAPRYDYILVDPTMNADVLRQLYGLPDHIDPCPLAQVWSWHDAHHLRPPLMANARKLQAELRRNHLVPPWE